MPAPDQTEGGVAPSRRSCQNQFFFLRDTILSTSTSLHLPSFAFRASFARIAAHHRFVLIASAASYLCLPSSHPSSTNFATMAPSLPNSGGETPSQRTRSKSDTDIDYAPQGMSAFISTMLVMFFAVIRRALDLASQSTSPLDLGLHHSAFFCLSYDAFLSRRTHCCSL